MLSRLSSWLDKKGNTSIGIKGKDFVVLAVEKKTAKKL
jgi:20S proteasome alpha/beta subunit